MKRLVLRASIGAVVLLAAATSLRPQPAEAEVIERVVAVVNADAIFLSELRRRAAPFLERAMSIPSEAGRMAAIEELYREVLDRMITEELFIQAAEENQVTVSRAEVDRAILNVRGQAGLDEAQFWQAVAAQGFTPEQYRGDVRRQLLRLKVLNNRARGRVNITETQVRAQFDMLVARSRQEAQYHAAHIFAEVPSGASATELAAVRRRLEDLREPLETAEDFMDEGGIDLGLLTRGSLPDELESVLANLDTGEISGVVRGPSGYHIFLLVGREAGASNIPEYTEVRMQIYQRMMEEAMARQEQIYVAELRRRAVIDIRL